MIYELSGQQKLAIWIMWTELGYPVNKIVELFDEEGYPIKDLQVLRVIRRELRLAS